jgi:hypothetical protein
MSFSINAKTLQLSTDMTVSEVKQRLGDIVQDPSLFGKVEKEYYGTITSGKFKITKTQGANRSSFYPVITGKIATTNDQTIINLSFRIHRLFRILIWIPIVSCVLNLISIAYNTLNGTDPDNAGWDYFLIVLAAFFVFMLIMLLLPRLFGFSSSTSNSIEQFKKIWKAEETR